jgi:site-specific DNA-methyltransferase (cytosine-N4-specific)
LAKARTGGWDTAGPAAFIDLHRDEILSRLGKCDLTPEVHFGDSRQMTAVQDSSVHLVVTSPPYPYIEMWDEQFEATLGLERGALGSTASHYGATHGLLANVWKECHRVLVDGGMLAVNIGDATRTVEGEFRCFQNHVGVTAACEEIGFTSLVPILWKKPTNKPNSFLGSGFYPSNGYVTLDCEYILLFRKGGKRVFPAKDTLRYASQFSKEERDEWFSQIWSVNGARQDGMAVFPPEIPQRLIRMFSILGDTVLDPFAGSGSTLRAARSLGRKAIGYEINASLKETLRSCVEAGAPSAAEILESLCSRYAPGAAGRASPKLSA